MAENDTGKERYKAFVRQNRVFILGAGFSAAAGIPLTASLLQSAMDMFARECPGLFERVDGYARECVDQVEGAIDYSSIDFSEFCTFLEYVELREYGGGERWKDTGSREKLALRYYIAKTLIERTPTPSEVTDLYLDFADQLHQGDIIMSFNWDSLLEIALDRLGKPYTYNFGDQNAIKLCKLHGSVNWRLGEPEDLHGPVNTLDWRSLEFTKGMMEKEIYHSPALLNHATWERYGPLGEVEPFLVLPGYGKAFDVRDNAVLWYKPEWAFATTHDVYIIGLSLAPDDFFIRSLFLSNLPFIGSYSGVSGRHIYIINPDPQAARNYEFVLSKGAATLRSEPFSGDHVAAFRDWVNGA